MLYTPFPSWDLITNLALRRHITKGVCMMGYLGLAMTTSRCEYKEEALDITPGLMACGNASGWFHLYWPATATTSLVIAQCPSLQKQSHSVVKLSLGGKHRDPNQEPLVSPTSPPWGDLYSARYLTLLFTSKQSYTHIYLY